MSQIDKILALCNNDPRGVYNEVERLARTGATREAIALAVQAGRSHDRLLSLAMERGGEGGFQLSILAAEEAISAADAVTEDGR